MESLTLNEKITMLKLLEEKQHYESGRLLYNWFKEPDTYPKHLEFLNGGKQYRQRAFLAGNRVGKTQTGAFEAACHMTGDYPDWWDGKRFDKETTGWVIGKTGTVVRDTTQIALAGPLGAWGTGMIPRDRILHVGRSPGGAIDYIHVKHKSGGISTLHFKSNDSGRQSFEGTAKEWIWLDEECDQEVYFECLMRTMTTNGIVFTTFTPMKGLSPLVLSLLKDGNLETPQPGIGVTTCGWDDAPHLTEEVKKELLNDLPPWQRLSRSRGIPSLGSGVIYPINPDDYVCEPIEIPQHWLRFAALDVGWRKTAALWLAINPEDGVMYATSEHYRGEAEPVVHAEAIKSRGLVPIVIDTAAHGRSQLDGDNLFDMYKALGLELNNANKAVETGLSTVWSMLSFGKLKVFKNCTNLLSEMKTYRRDEKGRIVKENDHLCDCLRYAVMTRDVARSSIPKKAVHYNGGYNPHTRTGI